MRLLARRSIPPLAVPYFPVPDRVPLATVICVIQSRTGDDVE
ncbi:hypothetical protein [Paenibacillus ihumii]|nr:hypothetical protein [Paenibacillus ihumii]